MSGRLIFVLALAALFAWSLPGLIDSESSDAPSSPPHVAGTSAESGALGVQQPGGAVLADETLADAALADAVLADPRVEGEPTPQGQEGAGAPGHTASPPTGHQQLRTLRRRLVEALALTARATAGDAEAAAEVERRLADEADPRLRAAYARGEYPDLGRWPHRPPPVLPEPSTPAEAGTVRAYWLTPGHHDGTYESAITIGDDGRVEVDTVFEPTRGDRWHVRYAGWAYRDAEGRLVVDARGQTVEYLDRPDWGFWSPDSLLIGGDGLVETIDDKHDPGHGTIGARGPG